MDDHKLIQESNLTTRQPCRAPITLYIEFSHPPVNKGLVNHTGNMGRELGLPAPHARCYSLLYGLPNQSNWMIETQPTYKQMMKL